MEMTYTESLSGVNNEPAAAEQETPVVEETAVEETTAETPETGENEGEQPEDPAAGDETKFDERTENAFAKRLSAERSKIEQEAAERATQGLLEQLRPILDMAEAEAKQHGMNPIEYARSVQANREAVMEQQYVDFLEQQADDLGIAPQVLHQIAMRHPAVQKIGFLEEQLGQVQGQLDQRLSLEKQFDEFLGAYPDFNEKPIPPEVFQLRNEKGYSLKEAYEAVSGRTEAERLKQENEQLRLALETKKKNEANAASAPGSVNGQGAPPAEFISRETFEQNKDDRGWVMKNLSLLSKSRTKW